MPQEEAEEMATFTVTTSPGQPSSALKQSEIIIAPYHQQKAGISCLKETPTHPSPKGSPNVQKWP